MRKANKETIVALALLFFSIWVVLAVSITAVSVDGGSESVRPGDPADSHSGRIAGRVLRVANKAAPSSAG